MTNLFKPKTPAISPPAPTPDPEDPKMAAALRRETAAKIKSSSSASTKLTAGGRETLGG